jgi:hypothetical protein
MPMIEYQCYHCGGNGWDRYFIRKPELWQQVLPPTVDGTRYHSGFVCFRCLLESIDLKLYREDFGDTPWLPDLDAQLWFPRRDHKRANVVLEFNDRGDDADGILDGLIDQHAWLLHRLGMHYTRLICTDADPDQPESEWPHRNAARGQRWGCIRLVPPEVPKSESVR